MIFALVNGQRQQAQPKLVGQCPACDHPMIAKCGEDRIWHWAHQGGRVCDPWWEETEWHRGWKGQFPDNWQEVVHQAESGEKHIADVKTDRGWVIEFQYSYLKPEERRSREAFYRKLIWVVSGMRRKRDKTQLSRAWNDGVAFRSNPRMRMAYLDDCALLREWADSNAPIFFDLGEAERLWWLIGKSNGWGYIVQFARAQFIESHRSTATEMARQFDELVNDIPRLISEYESHRSAPPLGWDPLQTRGWRSPRL